MLLKIAASSLSLSRPMRNKALYCAARGSSKTIDDLNGLEMEERLCAGSQLDVRGVNSSPVHVPEPLSILLHCPAGTLPYGNPMGNHHPKWQSASKRSHGCQKCELTMERVRERKPSAREEERWKG